MKALQRLFLSGHWAALLVGILGTGILFIGLVIRGNSWTGEAWKIFFITYLPIVAFAFVGWVFTGKFILWPWNRSLPKQED